MDQEIKEPGYWIAKCKVDQKKWDTREARHENFQRNYPSSSHLQEVMTNYYSEGNMPNAELYLKKKNLETFLDALKGHVKHF